MKIDSELVSKYWQEFKYQLIGNRNNSIHALETFSFKKFEKYGLPVLTEPCEQLDLIDEVLRAIIQFYKFLIQDTAQIGALESKL
jgi:hypothetical protein